MLDRRFSVAPMMECTDRFYRYFARLLTCRALLYTEMITTGAALHGDRARILGFDPFEHPVALQLGGSDPETLAKSARIGVEFGYTDVPIAELKPDRLIGHMRDLPAAVASLSKVAPRP